MSSTNGPKELTETHYEYLKEYEPTLVKREDFPSDFLFGAAGSAYQYEGAATEGGKGPSIWDNWTHNRPDKIHNGSTGDLAVNQYNLYKEDIKLLKKTGLKAYRLSISWPRVLPGGKLSSGINKEGIKYYNDLIDELLAQGIEPWVTLFHWDLPQALEHEYGGFLSENIVKDFCDFAELCFWEFGDRVKNWITMNEAWTSSVYGYVDGLFPPGHGSTVVEPLKGLEHVGHKYSRERQPCKHGNAGEEPYLVGHNFILAHASAVDLYRRQFQGYQGGKIGMTNCLTWYEPLNPDSEDDKKAAIRGVDFMFGWFVSPLVHGDYPKSMRENVGRRLPRFTPEQVQLVKGSYDFLGVNYYTTYYAENNTKKTSPPTYYDDKQLIQSTKRDGIPIGDEGSSSWLSIVPRGVYELLTFMKKEYNDPLIVITENGVDEASDPKLTLAEARYDPDRIKYHHDHLCFIKKAISENVNVKGYFIWSFLDNFEWTDGFSNRFGIFYIDFVNGRLTRYPKSSAIWWTNFMHNQYIRTSLKRQVKEIADGGKIETSASKRARVTKV